MNKKELARIIGERFYLTQNEALRFIDELIENMKEHLKEGEDIEIRNFGTFKLKKRGGRYSMDIRRGKKVYVAEHYGINFIPGVKLKPVISGK